MRAVSARLGILIILGLGLTSGALAQDAPPAPAAQESPQAAPVPSQAAPQEIPQAPPAPETPPPVAAAPASPFEAALLRLTADSFAETEKAIGELAATATPIAGQVLQAAADKALFISPEAKLVFFKDASGKTFDARTGDAVDAPPADLAAVRLNNKLRGVVERALGSLSLLSPDPGKRLEAAKSVFKSRDAQKLPLIDAALAKESDAQVKQVLTDARSAIIVSTPGQPEDALLAAITVLKARGDADAASMLRALPADAPARAKETAAAAASSIDQRMAIWSAGQNLWYGVSLGSVLLLAAIGLAITFGVMGVINMAHGEMVMIGAYTTFVVQEVIRSSAPGLFDYSLAIAIPMAFLVAGGIGVLIERGIIRFLYGRPLDTLLATWGLSLVLQQLVRTIFGPTNREVGAPSFMSGAFQLGELSITWNRLWIIVFAGVIFFTLLLALKYTSMGLQMRAVTQNRRMAGSMGIRTGRVDALTFGLGSGIAGLAGVALSQIDNVSPNLGQSYIIDSFLVVIFGGVGSLWGTLVGAMSLGIANKLLEPFAGAVLGKILLLVLIIMFIQKRPRGLFALKGRAIEQ